MPATGSCSTSPVRRWPGRSSRSSSRERGPEAAGRRIASTAAAAAIRRRLRAAALAFGGGLAAGRLRVRVAAVGGGLAGADDRRSRVVVHTVRLGDLDVGQAGGAQRVGE